MVVKWMLVSNISMITEFVLKTLILIKLPVISSPVMLILVPRIPSPLEDILMLLKETLIPLKLLVINNQFLSLLMPKNGHLMLVVSLITVVLHLIMVFFLLVMEMTIG